MSPSGQTACELTVPFHPVCSVVFTYFKDDYYFSHMVCILPIHTTIFPVREENNFNAAWASLSVGFYILIGHLALVAL